MQTYGHTDVTAECTRSHASLSLWERFFLPGGSDKAPNLCPPFSLPLAPQIGPAASS